MEAIETKPQQEQIQGGAGLPRHIVENRNFGNGSPEAPFDPLDRTLCGRLWDRLFVQHNGTICQECKDELVRRGSC